MVHVGPPHAGLPYSGSGGGSGGPVSWGSVTGKPELVEVVVYDGNLGVARPDAPVVYWRDFPSAPTHVGPEDIVEDS